MSLPRQTHSHSSSPSKSSLRRPSGPSNPLPRNLLPSPHFADEHLTTSHESPQPQDSYDEHAVESSVQAIPANFQPFFTLIEDPVTKEHHHPTVHYIFADDEADITIEAACRSLEEAQDESTSQAIASETTSRYLPAPTPGTKEHFLVLSVQPTWTDPQSEDALSRPGFEVTQAHSFSSEWQVLRTNITQAPTIGDNPEDEGLMLRIEGRGNTPPDSVESRREKDESLEEIIARFQRRLEDVRLVMEVSKGDMEKDLGEPGEH